MQFLRTEGVLVQRRDFEQAPGHNLQFSSGFLAMKMMISNLTIRGRSK